MSKVINFGCRLNNFEGKRIEELIPKDNKDIIVINSCAVTNETERQVRQSIRKLKKQNPSSKIVLTGCAAQISPKKYNQMEEIDHLVDNISKLKKETWNNLLNDEKQNNFIENIFDKIEDASPILSNKNTGPRESLVIQQGCNHRCTFCIIPFGRGNNRSFEPQFLINEVKKNVSQGVKEIVLTGVDISDYGSDFDKHYCMSKLILDILNQTELKRLRLSSIDCVEIDKHFDEVLLNPRVMPHLHLSIQSGDNMILKRMKRRHNVNDIKTFINHCRKLRSEITFGADIIAGFPTETDEMFNNTFNLLEQCNISHLHIFPFSPKRNTPAERMPQVEKSIIKERAQKLRSLGEKLLEQTKNKLSLPRNILIEEINSGMVVGYDQNYLKHRVPMIGLPIGEVITI